MFFMGLLPVITAFGLYRGIDFLISYFAEKFIPYLGFFPYTEVIHSSGLPSFISYFANFDGVHYIRIARDGHSEFTQAFFPLFPLVMRVLAPVLGNNYLLTGLLIANVSFFIGLIFFKKYLDLIFKNKSISIWTLVFLLTFPASFFLGSVYSDGLFFCFLVLSLYFLQKNKLMNPGIFAILASLTRLVGVFLIFPFAVHILLAHRPQLVTRWELFKRGLYSLIPVGGLLIYMGYLWNTTGDPLYFINAQPAFGANRSTSVILLPQVLYRYIKIFMTAAHDFRYWVSVFEFVMFIMVFGVVLFDLWKVYKHKKDKIFVPMLGLHLFSLANLLLPTFTGTLSSIPRYSIMALSFFVALARIPNIFVKTVIAILFFIAHVVMLAFFIQGYFVS